MLFKTKTKNNLIFFRIAVVSLVLLSAVIFFSPQISQAQILVPHVDNLSTGSIEEIAGTIIQMFLGLLGLIALVIILYAGFMWMTSAGNEEKISQAKKILVAAVIGLIIILGAYIITSFIMDALQGGGAGGGGNEYPVEGPGGFGSGALGGGVIEYHYPGRDAFNVPRNTLIMISFKVEVNLDSIIGDEAPDLCADYIDGNDNLCGMLSEDITVIDLDSNTDLSDQILAVLKADGKNVILDPLNNLGNEFDSTNISVELSSEMLSADGQNLFSGLGNGYDWQFEVSTFLDITPPEVSFVWPEEGQTVGRNAIIQINFSEPINILSVDGNVIVKSLPEEILAGELVLSNQYKTIEFLSNGDCGGVHINSCGEQIYCLPSLAEIETLIDSGESGDPLSGISDASGILMTENYIWSFNTDDKLYLTAPTIGSIGPANNQENVQLNPNIWALFDLTNVHISPSSVNTDSFYIYDADHCVDAGEDDLGLEAGHKENISGINCFPAYGVYLSEDNKKCNLEIYGSLKNNVLYYPRLTSDIKDSYGNCFNPAEGPQRSRQH